MNKVLYVLGSVEAMVGIVLFGITDLLKNIMPNLGRVAYQAAAAGSYSANNYILNASIPTT